MSKLKSHRSKIKMWDHLPSDILVSIFSRLSVKEVIRCSSIKKSFYKLIHSNFFVVAYNRQAQLYATNPPLILVSFDLEDKFSLHYQANNKGLDECVPLPLPFSHPTHFTMISCCNSVVCFCDFVGKELLLWNPYIQKSLHLPKPYPTWDDPAFGLGLVHQTSDYKVLMINHTNQAQLYSLHHNCWKIIANPRHFSIALDHPVFVQGSLYWLSSRTDTVVVGVFDLKDEVFGEISLPDCWTAVDPFTLQLKKHTDFSIALIRDDIDGDIQVMDLVNEKKWRKYSSANGSPWTGTSCLIYSNEKGEAIVELEVVRSMDINQKQIIGFGIASNYVNNLALLDKAGESSTTSKRRKTGKSSTTSKRRKIGKSSTPSKRRKTGESSTTSKRRKTGKSSTPSKRRKPGESSTTSKRRKTGKSSTPSKRRKTGESSTTSKRRKKNWGFIKSCLRLGPV